MHIIRVLEDKDDRKRNHNVKEKNINKTENKSNKFCYILFILVYILSMWFFNNVEHEYLVKKEKERIQMNMVHQNQKNVKRKKY